MNEVEYLNWLISDTVKNHPDLKWFMGCVADSLDKLTIEDVQYYYSNSCSDWEVLKYCAYQSVPLCVEHTSTFVDTVFRLLANRCSNKYAYFAH